MKDVTRHDGADRDADRDADRINELGRALPLVDLDDATARRIARRVRARIGQGPSPVRLLDPVVAAVFASSYLAWAIAKVLEALR